LFSRRARDKRSTIEEFRKCGFPSFLIGLFGHLGSPIFNDGETEICYQRLGLDRIRLAAFSSAWRTFLGQNNVQRQRENIIARGNEAMNAINAARFSFSPRSISIRDSSSIIATTTGIAIANTVNRSQRSS